MPAAMRDGGIVLHRVGGNPHRTALRGSGRRSESEQVATRNASGIASFLGSLSLLCHRENSPFTARRGPAMF